MTAVARPVDTMGVLDVSRPPRAVGWRRAAGYLTDVGLALLMALALPALLAVVLALVELLAQAVIPMTGGGTRP